MIVMPVITFSCKRFVGVFTRLGSITKSLSRLSMDQYSAIRFSSQFNLPDVCDVSSVGATKSIATLDASKNNLDWLIKAAPNLENIEKIIELMNKCRQAQWQSGFLGMTEKLRKIGKTYILGLRYEFPHPAHRIQVPECQFHPSMSTQLVHCGKTSFETLSTLRLEPDTEPMVKNRITWVYLDRGSGLRSSIPQWFRDMYCTDLPDSVQTKYHQAVPFSDQDSLASKTYQVTLDLIDQFGHMYHSFYVFFIIDTILDHAADPRNQILQKFIGNPLEQSNGNPLRQFVGNPFRQIDILYLKESLLGDCLKVKISENQSPEKKSLLAQIYRDSTILVQAKLDFYSYFDAKL